MVFSGKWRVTLLLFSPAILIALLVGAINLGAFFKLNAEYYHSDESRMRMLEEASILTDFNQRLVDIQGQMESLFAQQVSTATSTEELQQTSREISVRLTALDWEFGNRFDNNNVTAEIHTALDAVDAHRMMIHQALETVTTDPAQARAYFQAATAKQQALSQASNHIVEQIITDVLGTWEQHDNELGVHTRNTLMIGGLTIFLLLVLWLFLIGWLSRDLLYLTGAMRQLASPHPHLEQLPVVEKIASSTGNLMSGMARAVLVFRDAIKARQDAEQELRKLSLVVEQNPNGVLVTDLNCNIEYVNDAFVEMTGYEREWIIGRNPSLLRSGKTPRSTYESMWHHLLKGLNWQGEFINRRRDGSELIENAIIMPLREPSGKITHYVAIKHDITKRKKMQKELDRYHGHLEQLVSDRTRELNQARVVAEEASLSKSELLSSMSHEILPPMNSIIDLTHLVRHSIQDPDQQMKLKEVEEAAQSLLVMITNLLDLFKVETKQFEPEQHPFELEQLIDHVLGRVGPQARQRGLKLLSDLGQVPKILCGDNGRLEQVLMNLLTNAIQFTQQGEVKIMVELVVQEADQLRVRFKVIDTGIGISNEHLSGLFQVVEQADSSTTEGNHGNGLGLATSKRLVQLMGGVIGVESQPYIGSTFWFELPLLCTTDSLLPSKENE